MLREAISELRRKVDQKAPKIFGDQMEWSGHHPCAGHKWSEADWGSAWSPNLLYPTLGSRGCHLERSDIVEGRWYITWLRSEALRRSVGIFGASEISGASELRSFFRSFPELRQSEETMLSWANEAQSRGYGRVKGQRNDQRIGRRKSSQVNDSKRKKAHNERTQ